MKKFVKKLVLVAIVLSVCSLSLADVDTDPALLGWWKFDNPLKIGEDSSGHNYHGSEVGFPTTIPNDAPLHLRLNYSDNRSLDLTGGDHALLIDGGPDGVDPETVGLHGAFDFSPEELEPADLTISLWVKGWNNNAKTLISKRGEDDIGWQIRNYDGGTKINWTTRRVGENDYRPNPTVQELGLDDGNWHHILVMYDTVDGDPISTPNKKKVYFDGDLIGERDVSPDMESDNHMPPDYWRGYIAQGRQDKPRDYPVVIGTRRNGNNDGYDGEWTDTQLDDVRIYNKALSEGEIASLCPGTTYTAQAVSPANGVTGPINLNGNLQWGPGKVIPDHGDIADYDVWFYKPSGAWEQITDATPGTSVSVPAGLQEGLEYLWSVDTRYADGFIAVGKTFSFKSSSEPLIVRQPQNSYVVDPGATVTFKIAATDPVDPTGAAIAYQWFENDAAIPDATGTSLTVTNVKGLQNGTAYRCDVTANGVTVASDTVHVRVKTCIAQYSFDDPENLGKESRFGYDCSLLDGAHGPAGGGEIAATAGPDGMGMALDLSDADDNGLRCDVKADSREYFRTYRDRGFLSVSFWMKGWPGGEDAIISHKGEQQGWKLRPYNNQANLAWVTRQHDQDGDYTPGGKATQAYLNDGQWHHVVCVAGTDTPDMEGYDPQRWPLKIYVDGELVAKKLGPDYNRPGIGYMNGEEAYFCIGLKSDRDDDFGSWADIMLDEIRIYNYAVDADKVASLYANEPEPADALDGDANADGIVDFQDFAEMAANWLSVQ